MISAMNLQFDGLTSKCTRGYHGATATFLTRGAVAGAEFRRSNPSGSGAAAAGDVKVAKCGDGIARCINGSYVYS